MKENDENNFSSFKDIVKDIIDNDRYNLKNKFFYELIKSRWNDIIGNDFSNKTHPDRLVDTILYVGCSNQGLIYTLNFYKKDIIKNINELFKDDINIVNIKFFFNGKI